MTTIDHPLVPVLEPAEAAALATALSDASTAPRGWLERKLASLPRKVGRRLLPPARILVGASLVEQGSFRACDAATAVLLGRFTPAGEGLVELYFGGDAEERRMILKALPTLPRLDARVAVRLIEEAHRTNDLTIFEAGVLDSDLPARVLDQDAYNRIVVKIAFLDLPSARLLGHERRANPGLSKTLLDFHAERDVAGRPVWAGTLPLAARAPVPGLEDRVETDRLHKDTARRGPAVLARSILDGASD